MESAATGGRFSATGFTDQRQRLRGLEIEAQPLDRMDAADLSPQGAAAHVEARHEVAHAQDGPGQIDVGCRPRPHRPLAQPRHGIDEHERVVLAGILEHVMHRSGLDGAALPHDHHPVCHVGHHAHVVRDEQDRGAGLALDLVEEIEDLGLDGHVECGGGLVGDEKPGGTGKRDRDHDALAHAPGEHVRIILEASPRVGDAHPVEQADTLLGGLPVAEVAVLPQHLLDLCADPQNRVQAHHGLLEDHAGDFAAHAAQGLRRGANHFAALDPDGSPDAGGIGREQSHHGHGSHALSGAGFPDDRERLARSDAEVYVVHHLVIAEGDAEVADFQDRSGFILVHGCGLAVTVKPAWERDRSEVGAQVSISRP